LTGARAHVLEVRGLSVAAGGRVLLEPSSFALDEGERVLLAGPSGSGKSLFVDLLLGFAGPASPGLDVRGEILLDGAHLLGTGPEARDGRIGAVFQLHALGLFDDLTVGQNLRAGSADPARREAIAGSLGLERLDRPASLCSGGERVRVALARTLLRGSGVLLYDEPTTGLDATAASRVVAAIRDSHRRLTLVVTHDYETLAPLADAVLFLDPERREIRRLPPGPETFAGLKEAMARPRPPAAAAEPGDRPAWPARLAAAWSRAATRTAEVLLDWAWLLLLPLAYGRAGHPVDGPRVRRSLRRDLAPGVAAFVGISAVLVALTGTYFLFERLPRRAYAESLIQEDLVAGMGIILTRVAIPLLASVLLAAKLGASSAAHLGHMSVTRQIDALHLLRISPRRHLLLPTAAGQLAAAWVHTALATALAFATAMVVFLWMHPGWSALWFRVAYVQELKGTDALWLGAKVGVSALAVAATAYRIGTAPKREPEDVVRGIHATLLWGLVLVLVVHAGFAFLEFG
jgi:energy-coupling factor transporter ATP-binding protein EcfA2/ABC-type transporter Mla maintaining outer membrane lipid asymmetry permease subunit MlaE